jgi:hypothetical protein
MYCLLDSDFAGYNFYIITYCQQSKVNRGSIVLYSGRQTTISLCSTVMAEPEFNCAGNLKLVFEIKHLQASMH